MTIRLSAMFEEHMRRIIYNWKSARRRENTKASSKKLAKMRTRNNGQRTSRLANSSESEDEGTPPASPMRKSLTPRKTTAVNGHPSTSRSNGPVSRPVIRVRTVGIREEVDESSDEEDVGTLRWQGKKESDSEDSYKPNSRGKKILRNTRNKGKPKKSYCGESDESEVSKRTRAKTNQLTDDYDDSDNEPLVNCRVSQEWNEHSEAETTPPRALRSSHISQDETSQSSSRPSRSQTKKNYEETEEDTDEETQLPQRSARAKRLNYRTMLEVSESEDESQEANLRTRRGKRPHYNEDSDNSGSNQTHTRNKRRHVNEDSDSNDTSNVISISSRGRIRKLTPRAKAFLRD